MLNFQNKIRTLHLSKKAILYIRQSTVRQIHENKESTERQYALEKRAVELGWQKDQIMIIDTDLGISAASQIDRLGFQKLVAEVGMGKAGLVMGLEVSRLARSNYDWHKLLEICALTGTLILDEEGLYDPKQFNDRLLLGLKGSMSEAELHIIKARLHGGLINKAQKGELFKRLPTGYIHDMQGRIIFDPDKQIQDVIRKLFEVFREVGSAFSTSRYFNSHNIKFPTKITSGEAKGDIIWGRLSHSRVQYIIHNPCYAGAYVFGRTNHNRRVDGTVEQKSVDRDKWISFIKDSHPGYITWDEYEKNLEVLRKNLNCQFSSCVRGGPALLQGIVFCGICGKRMYTRYQNRNKGKRIAVYFCNGLESRYGGKICHSIISEKIDTAVENHLLNLIKPEALETTLNIQKEIEEEFSEVKRLLGQQVEKAKYETNLAKRRYMSVDPDNRHVAQTLEDEWNKKLKDLKEAEAYYEEQIEKQKKVLDEKVQRQIMSLSKDFGEVWHNSKTSIKDKKRLVRNMLESVTIHKKDQILDIHLCFNGGLTETISIDAPKKAMEIITTPIETIKLINELLDNHTNTEIVKILNEKNIQTGTAKKFDVRSIKHIRNKYKLKSRKQRLIEKGLLTLEQLSLLLNKSKLQVRRDINKGTLKIARYKLSDKGDYMYEKPSK